MNIDKIIIGLLLLGAAICHGEPIDLNAIAMIESSNNSRAIGDKGHAIGKYQIHAGVVKDFNRAHKTILKHTDMFNPHTSRMVADWYLNKQIPAMLKQRGYEVTKENIVKGYRGVGNIHTAESQNYLRKYNKHTLANN